MTIVYERQNKDGLDLYVLDADSPNVIIKSRNLSRRYLDKLVSDIDSRSGSRYELDFNNSAKVPEFYNHLRVQVERTIDELMSSPNYEVPLGILLGGIVGAAFGYSIGKTTGDSVGGLYIGGFFGSFLGGIFALMGQMDKPKVEPSDIKKVDAFNEFYEKLVGLGRRKNLVA